MMLAKRNYKVYAHVGHDTNLLVRKLAILDTGAGPNFIRVSELTPGYRSKIRYGPLPHITDANRRSIRTIGIISLVIQVGRYVVKDEFIVCERLAAPVILGCDLCDKYVEAIYPRKRVIELADGTTVPIVRRPTKRLADAPPLPAAQEYEASSGRISAKVKVAKAATLQPGTQTWVTVYTAHGGLMIVQPCDRLYYSGLILATNGLVEAEPGQPFRIIIANFGVNPYRLAKGQVVANVLPHPSALIPTEVMMSELLGIEAEDADNYTSEEELHIGTPTVEPETPEAKTVDDLDLSHLNSGLRTRLRNMLRKYEDMWDGSLGEINVTEHHIDLIPGSRPITQQPYRAGPKAREFEQEQIDRMLRDNVIEPSQSAWASPVVLVPKKDGTLRFCVDYRRLNTATVRDSYPIPRMDECIDSLGEAKVFTTLDCNSGYWQIPVSKRDVEKTAFVSHSGLYQFIRMPFGLTNAPATFQRTLDLILSGYRWKTCLVYLDDVIIFSDNVDLHFKHVEDILRALHKAGVSLKLAKCDFFTSTVKYLGHIIKPGKLEIDNTATAALTKLEHPETQSELRSFLGLCNVYRRFVPNYAQIAAPLTDLLKKGRPVKLEKFGDAEITAFKTLINAICSPPILALPRPGLDYSIDTDASNRQVGAALFQTHEGGIRRPIGFWSRTLRPAELNYGVPEKECLAVVWALTTLRPYLQGEIFTVHTDQSSLRWLMEITEPAGRLMRWRLRLSEFNFVVKYKKGLLNTQADALSRLRTSGDTTVDVDDEIPCYTVDTPDTQDYDVDFGEVDFEEGDLLIAQANITPTAAQLIPVSREEIAIAQLIDPFCANIRTRLNGGEKLPFEEDDTGILSRLVTRNPQVVVPKTLRNRILHMAHHAKLAGCPGGRKLYTTLRRDYYWPAMAVDCYRTVRNCPDCAKNRLKLRRNASTLKLFPALSPLESVSLDLLGELIRTPRGNRFLLVITDRFSKLVRSIPLKRITAYEVAKAFVTHWIFIYGPPRDVLTDNGGQFASRFFQDVCRIVGMKLRFTTTYHPQTNGQVERFNRTILAAIRHYAADHPKDWDLYTDALTFAYNTQVHSTTGVSPFELVLSRPPAALSMEAKPELQGLSASELRLRWKQRLEALINTASAGLRRTQRRYKRNFDRRLRNSNEDPKPGSYVFLRKEHYNTTESRHKLAPIATGPHKVVSLEGRTLVIQIGDRQERVSRDRVSLAPTPRDVVESTVNQGTNHPTSPESPESQQVLLPETQGLDSPQPRGLLDMSTPMGDIPETLGTTRPGVWSREFLDGIRPNNDLPNTTDDAEATPDNPGLRTPNEADNTGQNAAITPESQEVNSGTAPHLSAAPRKKNRQIRVERAKAKATRKRVTYARPLVSFIPERRTDESEILQNAANNATEVGNYSGASVLRRSARLLARGSPHNTTRREYNTATGVGDNTETSGSQRIRRFATRERPNCTVRRTHNTASRRDSGRSTNANSGETPQLTPDTPEYYDREYVIDKLVGHEYSSDGTLLFQIRWYGYRPEDDTLQPIRDIPRNHVVTYCRRRKLRLPQSIDDAPLG